MPTRAQVPHPSGRVNTLTREERMAWGSMSAKDPFSKIAYVFPHHDQDLGHSSPFGWYTPGLHEAAEAMALACTLPADIREPFTDSASVLLTRMLGHVRHVLIPIEASSFEEAMSVIPYRFRVFFSTDPQIAELIDTLRRQFPLPTLHVSRIAGSGRMPFEQLTEREIVRFLRRVLDAMVGASEWAAWLRGTRLVISGVASRKSIKHHLRRALHNLTLPNESALVAFGWKLPNEERLSRPIEFTPSGHEQRYIDRICASADAVSRERAQLLKTFVDVVDYRYVLVVSSLYWGHFERWRQTVQDTSDPKARVELKAAFKQFVQVPTYYSKVELDEKRKVILGPLLRALMSLHSRDMESFTAGLCILSAATLAPVIRLEPKLNQIRGDLKIIAQCVRAEASHHRRWKESRLLRALGEKMLRLVDQKYLQRIDAEPSRYIEGMKLVSDLPLELLPSRGVPLGLRFDVSRTPPIPGNFFWQRCMEIPIELPLSAFDEVLVVRSFQSDDPLRNLLENAISKVTRDDDSRRVVYRFVDVQSQAQFVEALATIRGAILIFDGHGTYDPEYGMGSLVVGGQPLDVWGIRNQCTFPPIVLFSACDTQPIDGSHSSVATAAFALGATAVLGTMFPIDGDDAAAFNARLLVRLESFLPAALKMRPRLLWREVISGMLRMTYTSEITFAMLKHGGVRLDAASFERVQMAANIAINNREANWFDVFLAALSAEGGPSISAISESIRFHAGMVDSLKYVQLGNPERLAIVKESSASVMQRASTVDRNGM
jgi:hypothetical protein